MEQPNPENKWESANDLVLNLLIRTKVITAEESSQIEKTRLEELLIRTADDFKNIPIIIPQSNIAKTRRILGLNPQVGEGKIDSSKRDKEIKQLIEEMRAYLEKYKKEHPEIVGLIICGSRMDQGKLPAPNSDVDVVLILKEGLSTESAREEGRALVQKLRSFTDTVKTDSGLDVELDEFYSADEFSKKMKDGNDKSKLMWGWNPKATYIGDNAEKTNAELSAGLNSPEFQKIKTDKIIKTQKQISDYLKK